MYKGQALSWFLFRLPDSTYLLLQEAVDEVRASKVQNGVALENWK